MLTRFKDRSCYDLLMLDGDFPLVLNNKKIPKSLGYGMPLFEYGCYGCRNVSEILVRKGPIPKNIQCPNCDGHDTVKLVSKVNFKTYKKPKYDDEFLGKALPSMRKKKETAELFAEGTKASDEAKMFEMSERIGERIDKELGRHFPKK